MIPKEIFENFNCIVFHMTDLPFGRGGSPLQNLLERKIYRTKISAIKCADILDGGDIYLKRDLDISYGSAQEIYFRASDIISEMIDEIIINNPQPMPQTGEIVEFKRRGPEQSDVFKLDDLETVYNYIRMLDAPGYPQAYIKSNALKYEFYDVKWINDALQAKVKIARDI
jgi:methionyl-tRNA formyltransferase